MKINHNSTDKLFSFLPSVYQDNMMDNKFVETLLDSYVEIGHGYKDLIKNSYNTISFLDTDYYKEIPISTLTLNSGLYDITAVIGDFYKKTGRHWLSSSTTINDKIAYLKGKGYYEDLSDTTYNDEVVDVISMVIMRDFSEALSPYEYLNDFVLLDNKLYLFNELAKPSTTAAPKTVLVKNIVTSASNLESKWGYMIGLDRPYFLSKYQYYHILKGVMEILANGAKLSSLKTAIKYISGSRTDLNIYDKYSLDLPASYKRAYDTHELDDFDFIVGLSPEYIVNSSVNKYIMQVLRLIKPAHTDFKIYYTNFQSEAWRFTGTVNRILEITKYLVEESYIIDIFNTMVLTGRDDDLLNEKCLGIINRLDANMHYITEVSKLLSETFNTSALTEGFAISSYKAGVETFNTRALTNNRNLTTLKSMTETINQQDLVDTMTCKKYTSKSLNDIMNLQGYKANSIELNSSELNGDYILLSPTVITSGLIYIKNTNDEIIEIRHIS